MISSFSYWIDEVSIEILAQNFLNSSGNCLDHRTVIFGSGAVPKFANVCRYLNDVFVTNDLPSKAIPARDSVTHVGSPENSALYSGVLANLTNLNFMMKWSIIS